MISSQEILYQDEDIIAVNKPHNLLVHRTKISQDTTFLLQQVRDLVGMRVFPLHRLDRPTSGIVLFAKNREAASHYGKIIQEGGVVKEYIAIVRGWIQEDLEIESPLTIGDKTLEAQTRIFPKEQYEIPYQISRYPSSRYQLVKVVPTTGRWHQIRLHLAKERHYILGDIRHGDCKHNKFWRQHYGISGMMLHAHKYGVPNLPEIMTPQLPPRMIDCIEILKSFS